MTTAIMREKEAEWRTLTASGEITWATFTKAAKKETSAFHDDFEWNEKRQAREYLIRRASQLIAYYSGKFNTTTAHQRLHPVPQPETPKGVRKIRPSKTWEIMTDVEKQSVERWYWQQWRTLAREAARRGKRRGNAQRVAVLPPTAYGGDGEHFG